MEIGATTGHGLNARNSAVEVARLEKEPAIILLLLLEEKTVRETLWNLEVVILNYVQVRSIKNLIFDGFLILNRP